MVNYLLPVIVFAPAIAGALLLPIPETQRLAIRVISLVGASISLAGSIVVAFLYDSTNPALQLDWSTPLVSSLNIQLHFAVDGWGVALLLLTGIIIVAGVFSSWTLARRDKEFYILLLVLVAGVFGVFVAQDIIVFFLCYEIAVLPMYLLIGVWGSSLAVAEAGPFRFVWKLFAIGGREYAAMKLTIMLLVGSAAILVGILVMAGTANSFDLTALASTKYDRDMQILIFPFLWMGFGTLGGAFPFHTWSPDGHASAPTAVSMLHAGVLMKLGAFGVMRIGIVMLGAATLSPMGWNGAIFQMVAHGIMTGLFFALVGLVYERAHTRIIARMGGFGSVMPGAAVFFTLACMSSLGLPGTAGFVAEFMVFVAAWQSVHSWWAIPAVLGAFVTAMYVLRAIRLIFWGPGPSEDYHHLHDAQKTEWPALVMLGAALVLFGFWPRLLVDIIDPTSVQFLHTVNATAGNVVNTAVALAAGAQ